MLDAQKITYTINVETIDGIKGSGTAVALSKDGKLITAYHNIDSAKTIQAVNYLGNEYNVTIGKILAINDKLRTFVNISI